MGLAAIADGVWAYEQSLKVGPGFQMPARTTIVKLGNSDLLLHSPLVSDDVDLDALGEVKHIVAPSVVHFLGATKMKERYPNAKLYGASGLEKKMSAPFEELRADTFGAELGIDRIDGNPGMNEHVFMHHASRSLLVSDLVFNMVDDRDTSLGMRLFCRAMGTYGKLAQSRIWRHFTKDRAATAGSARRILEWDFDRIIVGHGDVVIYDARAQLRDALAWMTSVES